MDMDIRSGIIDSIVFAVILIFLFYLFFFLLKRWTKKKQHFIPGIIEKYFHLPAIAFIIVLILFFSIDNFKTILPVHVYVQGHRLLKILLIISFGIVGIRTVTAIRETIVHHYGESDYTDFTLRRVKTKFQLIQQVINVMIIVGTIAMVLMSFEQVRQIGTTLLASAGIAGIVIGFAAQKSLGTIFSGIQIALTQPLKIDDIVIVDGKTGTVSELNLTYAVLIMFDEKRLIVPINYFLENSFENLTRSTQLITGVVKLYTDYTLPIEKVRAEFNRLLNDNPRWDKRNSGFLLTSSDEKTMELRCTMTAKNIDDASSLEAYVRENLITYILENFPEALPSARIKVTDNNN